MKEERYLVEGEFAFKSYMPTKLKVGMHFLTQITVGTIEPEWLFFTLGQVPEDQDMFMSLYGAPVHIFLVDEEGEPMASHKEVGWFTEDNDGEELHEITDEEICNILNKDDGFMDIECEETGDVILYDGKVIISYLSEANEILEEE